MISKIIKKGQERQIRSHVKTPSWGRVRQLGLFHLYSSLVNPHPTYWLTPVPFGHIHFLPLSPNWCWMRIGKETKIREGWRPFLSSLFLFLSFLHPLPFVSSVITHALHGKERNDWEGMTVFPLPHSSLPESIVKTKGKGWMEVMCEEAIGRLVSSFHSSFSLLASFPFGPSLITIHLYLSLSCLHQTDKVMKEIQEMNWRHANPSFLPLCLSSHASSTLGFTNIMVTEEAMKGKGKENEKGKEKTCRLEKPVNEQDISKKKGFSNYNSFLPFASLTRLFALSGVLCILQKLN